MPWCHDFSWVFHLIYFVSHWFMDVHGISLWIW
jgi:hypothetical protein